jgi:hypothetical protein
VKDAARSTERSLSICARAVEAINAIQRQYSSYFRIPRLAMFLTQ